MGLYVTKEGIYMCNYIYIYISDVTVVISNVLAHIGKTGRTVPN